MPARPLTILQLTHQGGGSGSTVAIANLSRQLARRGHRVLIGCRPGTMLAGLTAAAGLELVPLDFRRLGPLAASLGDGMAREGVDVAGRKDQHVLLEGLAALQRPVVVACVGIESDPALRAIERTLPQRHRVVYVPFTERPLAFARLADVSALPSRIEGLSIALLETMALGLPAVASRAGGNPDVITSGATVVLVPPLDPLAWAGALERVLGDPEFAQRIARAGRDLVRREFTLERTAERTQAVYREALERRRGW